MILDSGERREFESGAVRDIQQGKGRCDLLPLDAVAYIFDGDEILNSINKFLQEKNQYWIVSAINEFINRAYNSDATKAILEVSKQYEEGAIKYKPRNWQRGIEAHCYIDSGVRHYLKWLRGDKDEDHARAFLWNMLGLIWTIDNRPKLNDIDDVWRLCSDEAFAELRAEELALEQKEKE